MATTTTTTTFTLCMHKALIFTRKTRDHPLMVGTLFFLLFLYRFVPSLFFFLVSATPVIACTGVLLGVVLSHGEPNAPAVAVEEECERLRRTRHGIANLRSGVVGGEVFVEKSGGVVMEKDLVFGYEGCASSSSSDGGEELEKEGGDDGAKEEGVENFGFVPISKEVEGNGESSESDSDSDSDSDSNSDKSSSPDASMAEIMPMLDELHPLLDSEPSQGLAIVSADDNAGSEEWEDEKVENAEMEDEEEEDEEEEDKQGGNGDGTVAVVWTKEDEKNLALLGNSELERNRRLENLIARRRMRNSFKMLSEKNLIDFEGGGDAQPAPITTARSNPFDLHCDSNDGTDLPPIPGSAPSVLAKMRNPFDIPYDPLEEKPNLAGGKGSFEEEFPTSHEKDAHFRRYESFSTGSYLEKTVSKFRPYFVPSEGTAYSALQRQMSKISEAKTETESVTPASDQDYHKNKNEQEVSRPAPSGEHAPDHVKLESSSSGEADVGEIEQEHHRGSAEETESVSLASDQDTHSIDLVERVRDDVKLESSSSEEAEIEENLHERESASVETESVASDATDLNLKPEETQPSVDGSVDNQPKEPVYDSHWSPSEAENTLSGITIIQEALSYMNKKILVSPDVPVEAQSSSGVEHKELQEQSSPTDVRDPVDESCEVLDRDSSNDSFEVSVEEREANTNQPEKKLVADGQDIEADGKDESARAPSEAASCTETNETQKNIGVQGTCETDTSVKVLEARSEVEASSISKEPARTESEYGWAEIIAKVIELEVKPNFRNALAGGRRKSFNKSKSGVRETYEDSSSSTSTAVVNDASTAVVNDPSTTELTENEESGKSSSSSDSSSSSSDSDCTTEVTDNEESGESSSGSGSSSSSSDSD